MKWLAATVIESGWAFQHQRHRDAALWRFADQRLRWRPEMLDDVERHHAVEARRRPRAQEAERVADGGVETLLAAAAHHLRALVDAGHRQSVLAEQGERLAPAAAEVDDVLLAVEQRQIDGEAIAIRRRAPMAPLEPR